MLGTKVTMFSDFVALKHIWHKNKSKPRLIRWILRLQEFDLKIKDKKGAKNHVVNHLSRLSCKNDDDVTPIKELFPYKKLFSLFRFHLEYYLL